MDNRPIGVFDSGLGGLTAVRQIMDELPGEDIIYFGDTGRVPYGGRSRNTILKYTRQDIRFLLTFDIKAIVIACNTADTVGDRVRKEFSIPIIGALRPTARAAARATENRRIGVIGTASTIKADMYAKLIHEYAPEAEVWSKACPLFVPLVENGRFHRGDKVIELITDEYLSSLKEWNCDTLVLGCTHYPLLTEVISDYMGEKTKLINSGQEAAKELAAQLKTIHALNGRATGGRCRYYVSDTPDNFVRDGSIFLQRNISNTVTQVDIEEFSGA